MAKNAKPGYISFSYLDKPRVLQALVNYATSGTSKISYTKATELVDESIQSHKPVYIVEGRPIHIRFDQDSFNPLQYDEANGGHGSAKRVVQKLIETLIDKESSSFHESNVMHGVNGYIYCNQKGLKMYEGEKVRWYTIVVGSAMDIHTPHWHGNTVLVEGKRYDELDLIPGLSLSADMHATNKGKWLFHCHVNDHLQAGMTSLYEVSNRTAITSTSSSGIERECRGLDRIEFSAARDTGSIHYATAHSPVYRLDSMNAATTLVIFPNCNSSGQEGNIFYFPYVADSYDPLAITGATLNTSLFLPETLIHAVALKSSINILKAYISNQVQDEEDIELMQMITSQMQILEKDFQTEMQRYTGTGEAKAE